MTRHPLRTLLAASLFGLALTSPPLVAAEPHQATPAFAASSYWHGFKQFWTSRFKRTDSIVLTALGVGAVSLFIITRSRGKK